MESNMTTYKDLTPAADLDSATLNAMAVRSMQLQAGFNYERMQSIGWLWSILPGLKKIHTNKDDLAASMTHNMEFINTHPFLVTFVMGMVLSMEQTKTDINTIRAVRVATAAPLGGVGDALFWMTWVPIVAGITANMAIDGSLVGPILYFILVFGLEMVLRIALIHWSYKLGAAAVNMMTANAQEFTHAASILGVFIVGALIANYGGGTKLGIVIANGESPINVQSYLDTILPCLLALLFTLLCYFLIKKKGFTPTKCIVMFLLIGVVGAAFGIWAGGYTPLVPVPWTVA